MNMGINDFNANWKEMAYKSKYIICVAHIEAQNAKKLAIDTTAVVVPDHFTIEPMHIDKMNCAANTILLTIAMSVPSPRICARSSGVFVASIANFKQNEKKGEK